MYEKTLSHDVAYGTGYDIPRGVVRHLAYLRAGGGKKAKQNKKKGPRLLKSTSEH